MNENENEIRTIIRPEYMKLKTKPKKLKTSNRNQN